MMKAPNQVIFRAAEAVELASPFVVRLPRGRELDGPALRRHLERLRVGRRKGVYVLAFRGRSLVPWYVGKAVKQTFAEECTRLDKLRKFEKALRRGSGRPVLFFLEDPSKRRPNAKAIAGLERDLTRWCWEKNRELINVHNAGPRAWAVRGVSAATSGRPTKAVTALRTMLAETRR